MNRKVPTMAAALIACAMTVAAQQTTTEQTTKRNPDGSVQTTTKTTTVTGPAVVTRIQTTSVNSQGQTKTTSERTETNASGQTKTTITTVYGKVTAFQPGQSISIEEPGQRTVTYTIDSSSELPADMAIGKTVTIQTTTVSGSPNPVVRKITYRTTTKTTEKNQ